MISFLFPGKSVSHTASVRRIANDTAEQGHAPLLEVAKPHVNSDEKHVSSTPVIVLTAEEEKLLDDIRNSSVACPVPASAKRLMGKKTSSQKQRGAKGDGLVFTRATIPARLFKPVVDSNKVFSLTQEIFTPNFHVTSAAVTTFVGFGFVISAMDQISPLTSLFDQYCIPLIEAWLVPEPQDADGQFASVIDYDDATALTTFAQALDYTNVVSTDVTTAHYRKWVPHVAMAAYGGGVFTSFANVTSPWIDAASTGVVHYGLKTAATVSNIPQTYDLLLRIHSKWRNLR